MKTTDEHFADWVCNAFGLAHGSGQIRVLEALKNFMTAVPRDRPYDLAAVDASPVTPVASFLIVQALARAGALRYGRSRRQGLLTPNGRKIAAFMQAHTLEQLSSMMELSDFIDHCTPEMCSCLFGDCRKSNEFWERSFGSFARPAVIG